MSSSPAGIFAGPQFYSPDYFVRLSVAKLSDLELTHLFTSQDPALLQELPALRSCQNCCAGWTEWVGQIEGSVVSLAWDWVYLGDDGGMRELQIVGPRTNMKVIDAKGYDTDRRETDACLWERISRINWRPHVLSAALATSQHHSSQEPLFR